MRSYFPRLAGALLLLAGFTLLVTAPPPDQFDPLWLYFSLACFVVGFLLVIGLIGADPVAAGLRGELPAAARSRPLCRIDEQVFPYVATRAGRLAAVGLGIGIAVLLLLGAAWVFHVSTGSFSERATVAFPLFLGAAVCGWCLVRWSGMYVRVDSRGLTARLYFRTVTLPWPDVTVLVARRRRIPVLVAFVPLLVPLETVYSVYSKDSMICFTGRLAGKDRLTALISEATDLSWQ